MFDHDNATELNYEKSFPFDVIRYRDVDNYTDNQIRHIVDTVWKSLSFFILPKKSSRKKYRAVVKNYVLNLIKSYQTSYCIRVSRNRNDHHSEERYSHIFTTPFIVIKTMDALEENDWVDLHIGFYDKQHNRGKQTRLFPSQKFIDLVENKDVDLNDNKHIKRIRFVRENVKEVIQLRHKINDHKYKLTSYNDNPKTMRMRHRINQHNDYMRRVLTIMPLTKKELREMKPGHAETFNNMMLNGSIVFCDRKMKKGNKVGKEENKREENKKPVDTISSSDTYKVLESSNNTKATSDIENYPHRKEEPTRKEYSLNTDQSTHREQNLDKPNPNNQHNNNQDNNNNHNTYITTTTDNYRREKENRKKIIPITKTLAQINEQYQSHDLNILFSYDHRENEYYSIDQVLEDYPKSRKFWFRIDYVDMFRAFSDTSKTFNHHGRFYGDVIQSLPSWMRTKITMNHKEVVECDFTSIHPTMLYVMADAVPPGNIYMIDKGTDPQLRKEYKTVLLVSINHKNPDTMWSAVSKHFREEFEYKTGDSRLTKKYIMEIYALLLEHNKPIEKYMNTGVAMRLMRKDSEIADRIMHEFISNDIPIRCIHDSFIVPAEYEQALKTLMVEYFQEVMNTDYVIGITTETASGKAVDAPVLHPDTEKVAVV